MLLLRTLLPAAVSSRCCRLVPPLAALASASPADAAAVRAFSMQQAAVVAAQRQRRVHRGVLGGLRMCSGGGGSALADLERDIQAQGEVVRELKVAAERDEAAIKAAVERLLALKAQLPAPVEPPPAKSGGKGGGGKGGGGRGGGGKGGGGSGAAEAELSESEIFRVRLDKAQAVAAGGHTPYAYSFAPTHSSATFAEAFESLSPGAEDASAEVALCGRVMTKRSFGKLAFFTVQDGEGTFQLYLDKKRLGAAFRPFLDATDGGGFVGVQEPTQSWEGSEIAISRRRLCGREGRRQADGQGRAVGAGGGGAASRGVA